MTFSHQLVAFLAIPLVIFSVPAQAKHHHHSARHRASYAAEGERYLPHPAGCPRTQFCGCGAAFEIFGRPIRALWPAAAWLGFDRASPAPGRAAVRRHHVFVLRSLIGGSVWLVADFNSGGHRSRLHARSIAGYTIVDPHTGKIALR